MKAFTKTALILLCLGLSGLSLAQPHKSPLQKIVCTSQKYTQLFPESDKKQIKKIANRVSKDFFELTQMNLKSDRRCSPIIQYKTAALISMSQCLARAIEQSTDLKQVVKTKQFKKIQKVYSDTISNLGNSSKYCQSTHKRDYASLLSQYQANFVLADLYSAAE